MFFIKTVSFIDEIESLIPNDDVKKELSFLNFISFNSALVNNVY